MDITRETLSNGLNTLFIHGAGNTAGSVQMWFRAGSALEEKENFGIAHFLEHMFFKGTKKRPGPTLTSEIEGFGAEVNAFTSFDYTCYYINTPNSKLHKSLDILLDMVANPLFLKEDIPSEREVVHEEYLRSFDHPAQYGFQCLQEATFKGGYKHPILGSPKSIKNFQQKDLIQFRKNYYGLKNMLLIVAGDLKGINRYKSLIQKYKFPTGKTSLFPSFSLSSKPIAKFHFKEVNSCTLNIVLEAPEFENKTAASEDVLISCLGHGETSHLYSRLIIKSQLANNASASTMFFAKGGSHFIKVSFPFENLDKVFETLIDELSTVYKKGVSQDEVEKIKNQYIASKIYEKETIEAVSFNMGHSYAQTGNIHSDSEFIKKVSLVSASEANTAFDAILKRPIHCSLQLPQDKEKEFKPDSYYAFHQSLNKLNEKKSITEKFSVVKSKADPSSKLIVLNNNVRILYRQSNLAPTFSLHAYVKSGLIYENEKSNGSHHLIGSLISSGHTDCDRETLKNILENCSASLNGFSGRNAYGLTMHGLSRDLGKLLPHFFKSLISPAFHEDDFNLEKELTIRNIKNQEQDPVKQCFQASSQILFNTHPYAMNIQGSISNIESFNNLQIFELHQQNLMTKDILVTICGDVDEAEVLSLANKYLTNLPKRSTKTAEPQLPTYKKKDEFKKMNREQSHLLTAFPIEEAGHINNIVLRMITTYLSGQSSKLFVEVRDKLGLCYTVQPIHFMGWSTGYWGIYIGTSNEKRESALNAINTILDEIANIGISESEFRRIKEMISGQGQMALQTNDDYANAYSFPILHGDEIDHYHKTNRDIENMKYSFFLKTLQQLFLRERSTVTVGK